MDPHDYYKLVAIGLICVTVMVSMVAQYWFRRPKSADNRVLADIAERLAHLEQSVDAIAVETERISEGQRFTTKLLGERTAVPSASARS